MHNAPCPSHGEHGDLGHKEHKAHRDLGHKEHKAHKGLEIDVISLADQRRLLALARRALEARVRQTGLANVDVELDIKRGAFVSIFRDGELRGCLGRLNTDLSLPNLIASSRRRSPTKITASTALPRRI